MTKNDLNIGNLENKGFSISGVGPSGIDGNGDFNNDGHDDIIATGGYPGVWYVSIVYGASSTSDIVITNGLYNGIKIYGFNNFFSISSVAFAGDVNGDLFDDLIISGGNSTVGRTCVIFGKNTINDIDIEYLASTQGFCLKTDNYHRVSRGVGDINSDSFDDIAIGVPYINNNQGGCYILYGGEILSSSSITFISGEKENDYFGDALSKVGDFNGDNNNDIAIVARGVNYGTEGIVYTILGPIQIGDNSFRSFIINCDKVINYGYGVDVSYLKDINNDGYDDILIGQSEGDSPGYVFIIYGNNVTSDITLSNLTPSQGYYIEGIEMYDSFGASIAGIGDVNRDGFNDFVVGSPYHRTNGVEESGIAAVIYGSGNRNTNLNLNNLVCQQGFFINSDIYQGYTGFLVNSAGDFNNDGYADLLVETPGNNFGIGIVSIIYGGNYTCDTITVSDKIYATFSREVYADPSHTSLLAQVNGNGNRIPNGWEVLIDSDSTGIVPGIRISGWNFFSKVYRNIDKTSVIIAFQGTESIYDILSEDLDLAKGLMPSYYSYLKEFIDYVINYHGLSISVISFTGHSLGGFLAQLAAATYNAPAVVFESPGAKRVIDNNYYALKYSSESIKGIIKCYNAAPNLINTASGTHFEDNVIRLFPEYDVLATTFTLQQHGMSEILQQFNNYGTTKISADMHSYWYFSGNYKNWPYFEATSPSDIIAANSFLNSIFFENYNQNPYYWELFWDNLPNIDNIHLLMSTSYRQDSISELLGFGSYIPSRQGLEKKGITINGDNSGNKFFGGTNYADIMNGGNGNDEYWPFSGFNEITDTGGSNNYYFYTHNMRGTTNITDESKTGKIKFVNIGCSIGKTYIISDSPNTYVFIPQFDSQCNLDKYSSNKINHKNDIILLYQENDALSISYNNNDRYNKYRDKILIYNFEEGDFGIRLNPDDGKTYVVIGDDGNDYFSCDSTKNSILALLEGYNVYTIPIFNSNECLIISNDNAFNKIKISVNDHSHLRFLNEANNITTSNNISGINIYGLKNTDVVDLSDINLSNFSDLSYQINNNDTVVLLPGGASLNLKSTSMFVVALNSQDVALFNASSTTYTTNFTDSGIDTNIIYSILHDFYPSSTPTFQPSSSTVEPTSELEEDDNVIIGLVSAAAVVGVGLLGALCWSQYNKHSTGGATVYVENGDIELG